MEHSLKTDRAAKRWTKRFLRVRPVVLMGLTLCVGFLIIHAARLRNKNDIELWLGDQDAAVQEFQNFKQDFGVGDTVLIALDDCAAQDPRLEAAAKEIELLSIVLRCWTPQRLIAAGNRLGNSQIEERLAEVAPLTGSHPRFSGILVQLKSTDNFNRRALLDKLAEISRDAGFAADQTHWGGAPIINVALDRWAEETLMQYSPAVAAVGMICLWWSIRRVWIIFCVLFSGAFSVLATLALMSVTGASMNLIAIALPPMIFVLSLSFAIHLIHHWKNAADGQSAAGFAVLHTFRPTLLAACTTAIGSFSLATSQFAPVRNFGIWGAVGTIIAFTITYLWLPSNLAYEKQPPRNEQPSLVGRLAMRVPARTTVTLWPIVIILAIIGLLQLQAETDGLRMLPADCRTMHDYHLIERRLTGQLPVEVVVHQSPDSTIAERVVRSRQVASLLRKNRYVDSVSDGTAIYPLQTESAAALMQKISRSGSNPFPGQVTEDGLDWRLTAYVASDNGGALTKIVDELKTELSAHADVTVTGLVPLIVAAQGEIFRSLAISLMVAAGVLLVVLWIAFRSIVASLLIVLLNITPVVLVFGLLGWLGHPINMATLTTASIALGVALDDTMHLLENYRFQWRECPSQSLDHVVKATLQKSSSPMLQTTLIAAAGMGVLALSSFVPIAEFGGMIALLLVFALIGDTVLLPAILRTSLGNCLRESR